MICSSRDFCTKLPDVKAFPGISGKMTLAVPSQDKLQLLEVGEGERGGVSQLWKSRLVLVREEEPSWPATGLQPR